MTAKFHRGGAANWGISQEVLDYAATLIPAAGRTLETGAGHSTAFFARKGYRHTAITPSADEVARIRAYCAENGVDLSRTDFIVAPSDEALPGFTDAIDFFLIDGGHGFPLPQIDWYFGSKRLKVGGVVAIDDIHTWTGAILCDVLAEEPGWRSLAVIDRKTAFFRLDRPFVYREWNEQPFVLRQSKRLILRRKLRRFAARVAAGEWRSLYSSFAGRK